VCETIAVIFAEISSELDDDPPIETEAEARILRLTGIEQLPLENDRSKHIDDDRFMEIQQLPANQRARAESRAVDEIQSARRLVNVTTTAINKDRMLIYEEGVAKDIRKYNDRPILAAVLISESCMSAAAASEVKADGRNRVGVSPHINLSIVRDIFGSLSNANSIERYNYENDLGGTRQGSMPTHMYQTAYKRNVKLCKATRSAIAESGLNVSIFEEYINNFVRDPTM
jgi:hypothetical protein